MSLVRTCSCGFSSQVIDSRLVREVGVRRRRACEHCEERWTTIEISIEDYTALIQQRDQVFSALDSIKSAAGQLVEAAEGMPKCRLPNES